jgi:ABC-2 type transport system ATP-binding protein
MSESPYERAIEVEGLTMKFKKGPLAVDGIDLHVDPGEIYGFLGPNGAGKSTTVLMLTTLLPPTGGRATVGGYDIASEGGRVRGVIGAALQEAALDVHLTASEHMRLQTALQGVPKHERRQRGDELIERVGLADAADRKVGGYSGGMKRRLDLEEADRLADRVGIIDRGKIVAEGTPAALKAEIGEPSVAATAADPADRDRLVEALGRFGDASAGAGGDGEAWVRLAPGCGGLVSVVRELDSAGVAVADLQLHEPSLDDVFLEKTGRKLEGAGGATGEHDAVPVEVAA